MNYEIIVKPTFQREAKRLAKHYSSFKEDFVSLIDDLEQNPLLGTDLGHGLRKVRMKITSKGKGKSGGARVITFTLVVSQQDAVLNLLYIYDKADRASISVKEIEQLLKQNGLKKNRERHCSLVCANRMCRVILIRRHLRYSIPLNPQSQPSSHI